MSNPTRNLLITIQYDGTAYHGFQVQINAITVCEIFQNAVENVLGERLDVKGCSRTDSGVHALDYKLSMQTNSTIPCDRLLFALNMSLPKDIAVIKIVDVPIDFHARYLASGKKYIYKIHNSRIKDPFLPNYAYFYPWEIDEKLLDKEAKAFIGTHDFASFCSNYNPEENTIRTINRVDVIRNNNLVEIIIEGNGFLHNMVRIIVGTLLGISAGNIKPGEISEIINSKNRQKAGKTAPAHGLYLAKVYYPENLGVC